ncbi:MAG: PilZ domain-containing protein [Nitrospirae bacterium]|nr:PilZ domain-containing protein [Nitrospirota bacterium]
MDQDPFLPSSGIERRGYVRVEDTLPILHRIFKPGEPVTGDPSEWFKRAWFPYPLIDPETSFPWESDSKEAVQAHLLMELHRKLDLLVEVLDGEKSILQRPVSREVSLSASGIRLVLEEFCPLGGHIALYIVLPELPPVHFFVLGEVIRVHSLSGSQEGRYETGINFVDLRGEDQDRLIRYIFRKLRSELRRSRLTPPG